MTRQHYAVLQDLSLAGNQLTRLPDSIGNLRYLQRLQLAGNVLESLPDSLCSLTALQVNNEQPPSHTQADGRALL